MYTTKCKVVGEYRLNEQVSSDSYFANVSLMYAIMSQVRLKSVRGHLVALYTKGGPPFASFLDQHTDLYHDLIQFAVDSPDVDSPMWRLISDAANHNERSVISRDGAYKIAKSLIGGSNLRNRGRSVSVKAIRTLRGRIGSAPVVSLQTGECRESCIAAVVQIRVRRFVPQKCPKFQGEVQIRVRR